MADYYALISTIYHHHLTNTYRTFSTLKWKYYIKMTLTRKNTVQWYYLQDTFLLKVYFTSIPIYDGVRRVSGLRRLPVVSVKNPTLIPTSHRKGWSRPCRGRLRPSRCDSVHRTLAQNSQREGRSLPRQGRYHLFRLDVGISVGFYTETTGSLRNPKTRRTPPYLSTCKMINNW